MLAGGGADWVVFLERDGECWPVVEPGGLPAYSVGWQVTGWIVGPCFGSIVDSGSRWQSQSEALEWLTCLVVGRNVGLGLGRGCGRIAEWVVPLTQQVE